VSQPLLPTPTEMVDYLDRFVLGQARAKRDIAVAVYNHYLSQAYREVEGRDLGRHHILLIGPTGVGKTYLVQRLAEFLHVPVGFTSAAGLVEAGYVGNSVESVVAAVVERADGDAQRAEKGIVFIDEIDKIRRAPGIRDVSGEGVQNGLLTLLDGRISKGTQGQPHAAVDTSRLLFICTGAFVGLDDIVQRRQNHSSIGFAARSHTPVGVAGRHSRDALLHEVQPADLIEFGFIPEFVGRFASISILHELSSDDLAEIAAGYVQHSPLAIQRELAAIHGIDLQIDDDVIAAIAEQAASLGTGARGLHRLMVEAVRSVSGRWPELAAQGVTQVVIDRSAVQQRRAPRMIRTRGKGRRLQRRDVALRRHAMAGLEEPDGQLAADILADLF